MQASLIYALLCTTRQHMSASVCLEQTNTLNTFDTHPSRREHDSREHCNMVPGAQCDAMGDSGTLHLG